MKRITTLLLLLAFCLPAGAQAAKPNATGTDKHCPCDIRRADPPGNSGERLLSENPYWVFIGFLYAVIAADIALRFAKISYRWSEFAHTMQKRWWVPVYSHLLLASFVVGTSWIAWSQAFALGHVNAPPEVISWESLLIIVDFVILVMYFSLVLVVGNERESRNHPELRYPARKHTSYWVSWILSAYVVWDIFTYGLIPWSNGCATCFWASSWMTLFCAGLSWLGFAWLRRVRGDRPYSVLAADFSLIWLILLLRALKVLWHLHPDDSVRVQIDRLVCPATAGGFAFASLWVFLFVAFLAGAFGQQQDPAAKASSPDREA